MKKILIITGIVVALGLAAAGGFWGGVQYQANEAEQIRAEFFNARGQAPEGQIPDQAPRFPMDGQSEGQPPAGFRNGTIGIIKSIEGNALTISTAQDVATVALSDITQVNRTDTVPVSELQVGMRISVMGEKDSAGTLEANVITILNISSSGEPEPAPTEP